MKTFFIALLMLMSGYCAVSQTSKDSLPAYARIATIPPFKLMTAPDSIAFEKSELKKKKPVIMVVFSPDCEHCKHFTKELLQKYNLLKNAQIVMSSALNYDQIKDFYIRDQIANYPHITMGRDGTNFLSTYFEVRSFPTVIVYNKKGRFVKRFDGDVTIDKLAAVL